MFRLISFLKNAVVYVLFAMVLMLLLDEKNVRDYYNLTHFGRQTSGVVTRQTCNVHMMLWYRFMVGSQAFTGGDFNEACHSLTAGQPISVYYLPQDPKMNISEDPLGRLENEYGFIILGTIMFSFLGAYWVRVAKRWLSRRRQPTASP